MYSECDQRLQLQNHNSVQAQNDMLVTKTTQNKKLDNELSSLCDLQSQG